MITRVSAAAVVLCLALGAPLLLAVSGAAAAVPSAEKCAPFDIADADQLRAKLADADTVVEARVTAVAESKEAGETRFVHTARVRAAYSGEVSVGQRAKVVTFAAEEMGAGPLQVGKRYVIFGNLRDDDMVGVDPCSGTTVLKSPISPAQAALIRTLVEERDAAGAESVAITAPSGGVDEAPSYLRLAGPGAAIGLVGALGLLLVVAVGSRRL